MKKIKYIFLFILSFLFILPSINAEEKKQVKIIYSDKKTSKFIFISF